MPEFRYEAIASNGKKIKGTYEANTRNQVLSMIRQKNLYPVNIEEIVVNKDISFVSFFRKVKTKDIAIFCRQFNVMLNAGVTIISCLDILRYQTENKKLRGVVDTVYEDVQKGLTFSEALKNQKNTFPELLIHMVEAGEVSGTLDIIMDRMAVHYEKENKIKGKVQGAMMYPIILSSVSVLIVFFLLTFVMPTFLTMFTSNGVELPLPTRILMNIGEQIKKYWFIIFGVLFGLIYGIKKYIATDKGIFLIDHIKMKIPVLKGTTQKIVTSRFTRTMSTLLSSGIPLIQALEVVSKIVQNKIVEKGLLEAKEEVRKGIDLANPIKKIGFFPPMVVSMINIGEQSGSLDEILDKTANFYDEEVEVSLQKMVTLLEPLMIVIMAIVIGVIVIAMILPMFNMMNTIKI